MSKSDEVVASGTAGSSRSHVRILVVLILALIVAGVYGYRWFTVGRFQESTDDAYVGGDTVVLRPKVAGYIVKQLSSDNQPVHKGDLLVKIDERDYKAAVDRANATVAIQRALIVNLDATARQQRAVIEQARATVSASDAEYSRSRDDQQRYRNLLGKSAVSLQSSQRADADYQTAEANNRKTRAALAATERELDVIASKREQAKASLQQAEAELEVAQLNLGYTEVRSPVDGVVGNRRAREGAYAQVGEQLLAVVPARGLWIDANFKEDQLSRVLPGQQVEIRADALSGRVFQGRVQGLAPATGAQFSVLPPENATGNFTKIVQRVPIRILLDEKDGELGLLRPGLSVTAVINTRDDSKSGRASNQNIASNHQ